MIVWQLTRDESNYGVPKKSFRGHSHIVQDVTISADGLFALSASWDKTLRLWNIETGETIKTFVGHTNDVLSCSIAKNLRQIVSASRDKTIKLWNTIGECKETLTGHGDWVSAARFSPDENSPSIISAGWDKKVKVCFLILLVIFQILHSIMKKSLSSLSNSTNLFERLLNRSFEGIVILNDVTKYLLLRTVFNRMRHKYITKISDASLTILFML